MPEGAEQPASETTPRGVVILGSTGSIGKSALSVIEHDAGARFRLIGLSARRDAETLLDQIGRHRPRFATLTDADAMATVNGDARATGTELLRGDDAVERMVESSDVDRVLSAVVGVAGLRGTWAALNAGKTVALANKESLVVGGGLITNLARERRASLLPVDSEHSAIFQALRSGRSHEVRRVILTSSGGPFRGKTARDLEDVTPEQALRHPTWKMGPKITIDSATLMNKALEIVEARWLFDLRPDQIEVVIHPESIVHSMVEFVDGSVVAQLSPPDMRLPIQYALTYPDRVSCPAPRLDLSSAMSLCFEPPNFDAFPALSLGFEVAGAGGTAGAALNAANEVAVERFLEGAIRFQDIARLCRAVLDLHKFDQNPSLDALWSIDKWAREEAFRWRRS